MTLTLLMTYALALAVAAVIPGPGITAVVGRSLSQGMAGGLAMGLGLILGDSVYLTAVVFGLSVIARSASLVLDIIKYLGALYLAYVAFKIWTAGVIAADADKAPPVPLAQSFLSGFLLTLGNPKVMLFYGGLLPNLVPLDVLTIADYGWLLLATIVVLLAVLGPYVILADRARLLFRKPAALRLLNRGAASIIGATAAWIAIRA